MTLLAPAPRLGAAVRTPPNVAELQARINGMQASAPPSSSVPLRADLARLLPAGIRQGAMYQVRGGTSLMTAVLADASAAGRWVAWLGWPDVGAEALEAAGLRLDRTALIPQPGTHWLSALSSLADAMSVLAVRPPRSARVAPAELARLAGRLRERGTTLLVDAEWTGVQAQFRLDAHVWSGIGRGAGVLMDHRLRVSVRDHSGRVRSGLVGVTEPLSASVSRTERSRPDLERTTLGPVSWAVSA
ncbi:MAG TPA: hypothetical protein VK139_02820 [Microbacteriaceae bacterium]|nr:hypothetical protein [Microbacteriaceae bacterium]